MQKGITSVLVGASKVSQLEDDLSVMNLLDKSR